MLATLTDNPFGWERHAYTSFSHPGTSIVEATHLAKLCTQAVERGETIPSVYVYPKPLIDYLTLDNRVVDTNTIVLYLTTVDTLLRSIPSTALPHKEASYNHIRMIFLHHIKCLELVF